MNKTVLIILLVLVNYLTIIAQQITPKLAFLEKWDNSKSYLIAIAEAMPEDKYNFKPTERQMSFKGQLIHINENMEWLATKYFNKEEVEISIVKNEKERIISNLINSFNLVLITIKNTPDKELKETVDFFAGPKSKLQILNLLQDHVTHHRGQLIVYLNLNKIEPPRYSGW